MKAMPLINKIREEINEEEKNRNNDINNNNNIFFNEELDSLEYSQNDSQINLFNDNNSNIKNNNNKNKSSITPNEIISKYGKNNLINNLDKNEEIEEKI